MSLFFQFLKPVQSEVVALSQRGVQVCMPCSQRCSTVLTQSLTVQGNLATPWNAGLQLAGRYVGVIKCKCSFMRINLMHWTFKLHFWFREEYYQVLVLQRTECTKVEVCMESEKQLNQMGLLSPLPSTKTMSLPMLFPMNRKICVIFSTLQQCSMYRNISVPSLFWFSLQWRKQFWLVQYSLIGLAVKSSSYSFWSLPDCFQHVRASVAMHEWDFTHASPRVEELLHMS